MTEATANQVLSLQATQADAERARVAAWAARNQPRTAHRRPSLFVRIVRAIAR